jgi:hypothetical protein
MDDVPYPAGPPNGIFELAPEEAGGLLDLDLCDPRHAGTPGWCEVSHPGPLKPISGCLHLVFTLGYEY